MVGIIEDLSRTDVTSKSCMTTSVSTLSQDLFFFSKFFLEFIKMEIPTLLTFINKKTLQNELVYLFPIAYLKTLLPPQLLS